MFPVSFVTFSSPTTISPVYPSPVNSVSPVGALQFVQSCLSHAVTEENISEVGQGGSLPNWPCPARECSAGGGGRRKPCSPLAALFRSNILAGRNRDSRGQCLTVTPDEQHLVGVWARRASQASIITTPTHSPTVLAARKLSRLTRWSPNADSRASSVRWRPAAQTGSH